MDRRKMDLYVLCILCIFLCDCLGYTDFIWHSNFHCSKSETPCFQKKVLVALQFFYQKSCSQDRSTARSINLCLLSVMKISAVVPAMVHVGLSCPCPCKISKPSIMADTVKLRSPAIFCTIPGVVKYRAAWTIQVKQVLPLKRKN